MVVRPGACPHHVGEILGASTPPPRQRRFETAPSSAGFVTSARPASVGAASPELHWGRPGQSCSRSSPGIGIGSGLIIRSRLFPRREPGRPAASHQDNSYRPPQAARLPVLGAAMRPSRPASPRPSDRRSEDPMSRVATSFQARHSTLSAHSTVPRRIRGGQGVTASSGAARTCAAAGWFAVQAV